MVFGQSRHRGQDVINDLSSTGAIKAYLSVAEPVIQLFASDKAAGPYAQESVAALDAGSKTITVPINGQSRFYRLKAPSALTITSIVVQGQNVVLKYK